MNLSRLSIFMAAIVMVLAGSAFATDLSVQLLEIDREKSEPTATIRVTWENAWRNQRNFDAAWVVLRYSHVRATLPAEMTSVALSPARPTGGPEVDRPAPEVAAAVSEDRQGFFVFAAVEHRGPLSAVLTVTIDPESLPPVDADVRFSVHGVEMVYIPAGPFYLGEPPAQNEDPDFSTIYRAAPDGSYLGLYQVVSEGEVEVGPDPAKLWYRSEDESSGSRYQGDQAGPIPAEFPKGFQPFFIMKYEMSQGEYVHYLNHISGEDALSRAPLGFPGDENSRLTIRRDGDVYAAGSPKTPMNYLSWTDASGWTDWIALRPLTELEYVKAARGPREPERGDHAWGSASADELLRIFDAKGEFQLTDALQEARLSDDTLDQFGASYWWVMDLNSSLWERCVSIGSPEGRRFVGSHGDGRLSWYLATADNPDWPRGDEAIDPMGSNGYGYRGGGTYDHTAPDRGLLELPVAFRGYAAWGEGPRRVAYGHRAARTAPSDIERAPPLRVND